jgi:hypothetical protein
VPWSAPAVLAVRVAAALCWGWLGVVYHQLLPCIFVGACGSQGLQLGAWQQQTSHYGLALL